MVTTKTYDLRTVFARGLLRTLSDSCEKAPRKDANKSAYLVTAHGRRVKGVDHHPIGGALHSAL